MLGFDLINGVFLSVTTVVFCILLVEALRGRLMGLWGMAPFGTLLSGALVEAFDERVHLIARGVVFATGSGWMWFVDCALRPAA